MPPSPRKTRSASRRVSGNYDGEDCSPVPAHWQDSFPPHLAVTPVPVMKASSMEPVRGYHPGNEKRARHKMTDIQLRRLEELYRENTHPSRAAKEDIARETGMLLKTVLIWFQNRRQDRRRSKAATQKLQAGKKPTQKDNKLPAPAAKPKPAAQRRRKPRASGAADMPTTAASHATPIQNTQRQQPSPSDHTVSSHADESMDMDGSPSSTAPTSVHAQPMQYPARIARSPSSSLDSSSADSTSPHALWRLVAACPPPPPPFVSVPVPSRRPFDSLQSNKLQSLNTHTKPDLEWACANSAARRKHGRYVYRDEDDSEGEGSERSEGLSPAEGRPRPIGAAAEDTASPRLRRRWQQRHGPDLEKGRGATVQTLTAAEMGVVVPREYDLLFPPDMILGAALLLTLKHSVV
ncbi:hypothetical protein C2E23DRAFT_899542 [Lenzites betulinus]|nr:hypothetical protein C2E23DRAFT_899542 [Lenzites betulinus]